MPTGAPAARPQVQLPNYAEAALEKAKHERQKASAAGEGFRFTHERMQAENVLPRLELPVGNQTGVGLGQVFQLQPLGVKQPMPPGPGGGK